MDTFNLFIGYLLDTLGLLVSDGPGALVTVTIIPKVRLVTHAHSTHVRPVSITFLVVLVVLLDAE